MINGNPWPPPPPCYTVQRARRRQTKEIRDDPNESSTASDLPSLDPLQKTSLPCLYTPHYPGVYKGPCLLGSPSAETPSPRCTPLRHDASRKEAVAAKVKRRNDRLRVYGARKNHSGVYSRETSRPKSFDLNQSLITRSRLRAARHISQFKVLYQKSWGTYS